MTPKQIAEASTDELINTYKEKARCKHSEYAAGSIYNELLNRVWADNLAPLRLATWHMQNEGNPDSQGHYPDYESFDDECEKLIAKIKSFKF